VAAVGTNIPIYTKTYGGWVTVAGTSISAPLVAGVYGLAGNASTIPPGYAYAHARSLFDVTAGNNALFGTPAATCGNDYMCVAKKGYDAPTGMGTPDGTGAF
jgi:subtilisin family serine protease